MKLSTYSNTLKGRLLYWLMLPLLLLSVAHLSSIYIATQRTSTVLFDRVLINLALSISEYAISSEGDLLTGDLLELIHQTSNDKLFYKVLGPGGSFIVGYHDLPAPPGGIKKVHNHIEFYDSNYLDQPVRIVAVSTLSEHGQLTGWAQAFVAQTIEDRNQYVMDAMVDNLIRIVFLAVIVIVMLIMGVNVALKPLKRLLQSLEHRDIHDLTALNVEHMPAEISVLTEGINDLLLRLSNQIGVSKRFLENASHQLLTPITALTLQCDMALRQATSGSAKRTAAKIKANADRISRLANQLLHLSYSEAAAFDNKKNEAIDLAIVARDCVSSLGELVEHRTIAMELSSAKVFGNEILFADVFHNLLDNALKYGGHSGAIRVSTYVHGRKAVLEVSDEGQGIAPELRQLVTDRFFRASSDQSGSGLGLAIVKEIVLVYRGEIHILSGKKGRGTCIRCLFNAIQEN